MLGASAEVVAPLVDAFVHVLDGEALLIYGQQAGEIGQAFGGIDEPVAGGFRLSFGQGMLSFFQHRQAIQQTNRLKISP